MASDALASHLIFLLKYQVWQLERAFERLDEVSDEDYHADAGLVFRSIHGVLNHLLSTLQLWGRRLQGSQMPMQALYDLWEKMQDPYSRIRGQPSGWEKVVEDRKETQKQLMAEAKGFVEFAERELRDILATRNPVAYTDSAGAPSSIPAQVLISHVVNHTSYHIGQITVGFRNFRNADGTQKYGDMDALDMSYMPR